MSSLYTKIVSNVFFPLHEKLKKHTTVSVHKAMEKNQWLKPEDLADLQLERLKVLLISVGKNVPYYKNLFQELDFNPLDVQSIDDLKRLPFLDKPLIKKHSDDLKSVKATSLSRFNTGGSSGEPLVFYISNERVSHDVAAKWRATRWWDVDIGDKEIVVWGSPVELGAQDRVRLIRDKFLRTKLIPAFEMSEKNLDVFVDEIKRFMPKMLFGYPSSLSLIAQHAEKKGICLNSIGVKVAFVTSEKLYDNQRETIERVFGCKVANGYGGRDAGFIAHECPSGRMHITFEDIIVEIVASNGNTLPIGEPGEIVVTHLATQDYPFIRYKTGDVGSLSNKICECGRGLPILEEIQGRSTDFVVAQDGTVMHGLSLIYILRDIQGVVEFKIEQENIDSTIVKLVINDQFESDMVILIKESFRERLGGRVNIRIDIVEKIEPEKSGKFRYVVSHIKQG